jgi:predicted PurR-regulated permease PerM
MTDLERSIRRTHTLLQLLLGIALLTCLWLTLSQLSMVLAPVIVALVLAFLLDPSVRALEARGVPRWLAVVLMVLGFVGLLVGLGFILPFLVRRELEGFADRWPYYEQVINNRVLPWVARFAKERRLANFHDWSRLISDRLGEWVRGAAGQISEALESTLAGVAGFVRVLVAVLLVPIFAVSFLMSMPQLMNQVRGFVPPRHQHLASDVVRDLQTALGGWLRGQLTVMLIQALLYSVGLSLCGIPLAIVIGCTAGLLAFVPYVGVSIGLLAAVLAALLDLGTRGAAPLLGVLATFGGVQLLDALLITPRAVGGRIGLSAVGVIFALSLGGNLLGYAGLLLAVPFAAVIKALTPRLFAAYTATRFYNEGAAAPEPDPDNDLDKQDKDKDREAP